MGLVEYSSGFGLVVECSRNSLLLVMSVVGVILLLNGYLLGVMKF